MLRGTRPARRRNGATSIIRPRRRPDVAVLYSAGPARRGRPHCRLRPRPAAVSTLQQRLVDAQQSLERDYSRIRHVETRYRLLFQIASDAC